MYEKPRHAARCTYCWSSIHPGLMSKSAMQSAALFRQNSQLTQTHSRLFLHLLKGSVGIQMNLPLSLQEKKNNTAFSKSVWVDNKLQCLILYKTLFEYNRDDTKESDMTEAI